jgi:hypothetical protein
MLTREEKQQRKARRLCFLVRVANERPDRFAVEWEREIGFWLQDIREELAGGSMTSRCVFEVVREAQTALAMCGQWAVKEHGRKTVDILSNECCRAVASMTGSGVYRMNAHLG